MRSIIIPPPAPTNPQTNPIRVPQTMDWISRVFGGTADIRSLVVITGRNRNLIPSSRVIKIENPPIRVPGSRLDTQLDVYKRQP